MKLLTYELLSAREGEIARAAASGLLSKQIARQLHLSESTVKFHLSNVYKKLGVRNRTQLTTAVIRPEAGEDR